MEKYRRPQQYGSLTPHSRTNCPAGTPPFRSISIFKNFRPSGPHDALPPLPSPHPAPSPRLHRLALRLATGQTSSHDGSPFRGLDWNLAQPSQRTQWQAPLRRVSQIRHHLGIPLPRHLGQNPLRRLHGHLQCRSPGRRLHPPDWLTGPRSSLWWHLHPHRHGQRRSAPSHLPVHCGPRHPHSAKTCAPAVAR